jgi:hypothetical protein
MILTEFEATMETTDQAYNRFLNNYLALAGREIANMEWFEQHVPSLLALAVVEARPPLTLEPFVTRRGQRQNLWNRELFIEYYSPVA